MTMPNKASGARAERRRAQHQIGHEVSKMMKAMREREARIARVNEQRRRRYARLSVERLVFLGERAGLVVDAGEEGVPRTPESEDDAQAMMDSGFGDR